MDPAGLAPLAFVDRSDREKISFEGPQAHWFLDQLLTNQIEGLAAGEGCEALLLTPKGKITAVLQVLSASSSQVLVDADPRQTPTVAEFFSGRIFSTRVEVEDITDAWGMLRLVGGSALAMVRSVLRADPPAVEHSSITGPDDLIAVARPRPFEGWDIWFPSNLRESMMETLSGAGAVGLEHDRWEAMRVAGGVLSFEKDLAGGFLPQEAALEKDLHFSKGCYLGQEAVAMAQRGRVSRRFRHLHFEGSAVDGEVFLRDKAVGSVTSWADWDGAGYGLAPLASSVAVGSLVEVGPSRTTAEVHTMPGETEGPGLPSARELRERLARGVAKP